MRLNPNSTDEHPNISRTATRAILPVAAEVVFGTVLLGWAMLSIPKTGANLALFHSRWEDMISVLAEYYAGATFGPVAGKLFGVAVGIVVGLLLLSAVNTAIAALIGLFYMMARDGEMPRAFTRLNTSGVPWVPLFIAFTAPALVVALTSHLQSLAGLYAIGVVGAITVNLGACFFNKSLPLRWFERFVMGISFIILLAVELTIAKTKPDALFFAVCVLGSGLALRSYAQRRAGFRTVTVSHEMAAQVAPEMFPDFQFNFSTGQKIMVAARGNTPVLRYALEEAQLRQGALYVLYVKELAVAFPGFQDTQEPRRWQDDSAARSIMYPMIRQGKKLGISVVPLYTVSDNAASSILDLAATLGVDILMLGASHRSRMANLLRGNVVAEVARHLPENIQLVIHS